MGTKHRKSTCRHCGHQFSLGQLKAHETKCAPQTPEERELTWRRVESARRTRQRRQAAAIPGNAHVTSKGPLKVQRLYDGRLYVEGRIYEPVDE